MHTISTVENPAAAAASRLNGISDVDENSKDRWSGYDDSEQLTDLINDPDDDHQSEGSDFEDSHYKRRKKPSRGKGGKVCGASNIANNDYRL